MSTAAQALEAIHLALSRLNYDRKRQLEHARNIRRHQHVLENAADEYLRLLSRELRTRISRPKGKTPSEIAKKIVDWEAVGEDGRKIFNKALLQVAQQQAAATVTRSSIVKQSRPDLLGQKAIEWANKNAAKLVTAVNNETRKAIREAIKTGLNQGQSIKEIARDLKPMIGLNQRQHEAVRRLKNKLINAGLPKETIKKRVGRYAEKSLRYRARMIARTETAGALSDGNLMGLEAMGATHVKGIADVNACEVCLSIINGQVYKIQEAFGMIPVHPNCLLGDSLISPGGRITGASKRWYKGKIVIIQTASGRKLRCTPNHPVLTNMGFLPARFLNVGSGIICQGLSQRESFADWKDQYAPTTIEEITDSFLKPSSMTTMEVPISSEDFHGDGMGSKVAIIGTNGFLENRLNTPSLKHPLKLQLIFRAMLQRIFFPRPGRLFQSLKRLFTTPGSIMGCFELILSLLRGHLFPAKASHFALCTTAFLIAVRLTP